MLGDGLRVIGYLRVSTDEQGLSGAGLAAQRQVVEAECTRRGWHLVAVYEDIASGRRVEGRPGLRDALAAVESGEAGALVVAKLDRLSRSLLDFAEMMERGKRRRWSLVALDLGFDMTTAAGEMVANMLAVFAEFERRLIGDRTRAALAVKKQQGVRLGRPSQISSALRLRMRRLRRSGLSYSAIAARLNDEGVATAQGGASWHDSTIRVALRRNQRE
jgi:DNA invertase Pin-like site-specific DNA recombinase